jgi:DNA (cytosine-5)-methyltransferase 1
VRPPVLRVHADELVVDNFAGGGGASLGIERALGRSPDIAVNHDPEAIAMHKANHPETRHFCEDVWKVDPKEACGSRRVALAWFSPDCKHFSKAKGGKPVEKNIRGLAWVVTRWAKAVKPRVIILENVEEFQDWGPLLDDGRPCPVRRGLTFRRWVGVLRNAGYEVQARQLRACDYGAPTSRKRLFIIARSDGLPIVWPKETHGPGLNPYRTAAECIEWELPSPSIFERTRPLAENTLKRIARGIRRYVIEAAEPFIVPVAHQGDERAHSIRQPFRTVTGAHRGEHALIEPFLLPQSHGASASGPDKRSHGVTEPFRTVTTLGAQFNLISPTLIQRSWGEREGQAPRALDIEKPLGTIVAGGIKHALVAAFLARHYSERKPYVRAGKSVEHPLPTVTTFDHHSVVTAFLARHYGGHENDGAPLDKEVPTVTAKDHHAIVTSHLLKLRGGFADHQVTAQHLGTPAPTITAGGNHLAEVRAFLVKYYGTDQDPQLGLPLHTLTTKHRFGLVTVHGHEYVISDIGMRMLVPRELFRAQGFGDEYQIEVPFHGKPLSKTAQVRMCGNSVNPDIAQALVIAQFAAASATSAGEVA